MTENKKILSREETKEKALRILEFRSHSTYELTEKLKRAGSTEEDIEYMLAFCNEYNLINDAEYAKMRARDLSNLKKFGKHRIKSELFKCGLSNEDIQSALAEIEDDTDELELLISKKLKGNFEQKNCDKAIRYFLYRGYGLSDIKNTIERLKSDGI